MQRIEIHNEDRSITAEVMPDYGGMVARLRAAGRDVLYLDEGRLADSPVSAGGIPVLFPFAGRTKNDRYTVNGAEYHMPMHGVVKNRPFAVKERRENAVTVWVKEDEALLNRNYPFPHTLEITYGIVGDALEITARIENRSREPMPHTLGLHPYFKASNRASLEFNHAMTIHYDYVHEKDAPAPDAIGLDGELDDVFCLPRSCEYTLANAADGYRVHCVTDKSFQSIVVYTGKPGSVCIEPWCGIPNSANNKRMIQWIAPGGTSVYKVAFHIAAILKRSGR